MPMNVITSVACPPGCIVNEVEVGVIEKSTTPVPNRGIDCWPRGALSTMLMLPVRLPNVLAVNVTLIVQEDDIATELPQSFVAANGGKREIPDNSSGPLPLLESMRLCAGLVLDNPTAPKLK